MSAGSASPRKSRRSLFWLLAGALALVTECAVEDTHFTKKITPPADAGTLAEFLEQMPPPRGFRTFTWGGHVYVQVTGHVDSGLTWAPSGPPVYVFSANGVLVDWTADIGDDSSFINRWGDFRDAEEIDLDELRRRFLEMPGPGPASAEAGRGS